MKTRLDVDFIPVGTKFGDIFKVVTHINGPVVTMTPKTSIGSLINPMHMGFTQEEINSRRVRIFPSTYCLKMNHEHNFSHI